MDIEQQLARDIKTVIKYANDGDHPDDAIAKVAEAQGYNPDMIQNACGIFNKSKTASYLKEASSDKRGESFALADPKRVMNKIYMDEKEAEDTASVPSQSFTDMDFKTVEKEADEEKDEPVSMDAAEAKIGEYTGLYKKAVDKFDFHIKQNKQKMEDYVEKVAEEMNKMDNNKLKKTAQLIRNGYPEYGDKILNLVQTKINYNIPDVEKTAHAAVFPSDEPYISICNMCDIAYDTLKQTKAKETFEKTASLVDISENAAKGLRWLTNNNVPTDAGPDSSRFRKVTSGVAGDPLTNRIESLTSGKYSKGGKDKLKEFLNTDVHNTLKEINAKKTFLTLALYDDHLNQYDMDTLADAYNSVSQASPGISDNPAQLKPRMMRWLEQGGYVSAEQMAQDMTSDKDRQQSEKTRTEDIEKKKKETDEEIDTAKPDTEMGGMRQDREEALGKDKVKHTTYKGQKMEEKEQQVRLNKDLKKLKEDIKEGNADRAKKRVERIKKDYEDIPKKNLSEFEGRIEEELKRQEKEKADKDKSEEQKEKDEKALRNAIAKGDKDEADRRLDNLERDYNLVVDKINDYQGRINRI